MAEKEEIAIIGMACRIPKCDTPDELWKSLLGEIELISHFSKNEIITSGIPKELYERPNFVSSKGYIEYLEEFDNQLFSITGREAKYMDPQQRLLFECTWEVFEDAGLDISSSLGLVGVFIGGNASQYFIDHLSAHLESDPQDAMLKLIGNGSEYLATRLSYAFNFRGQSQTVQTACSSSLVAVHYACRSLLSYECDLAISGGVSVTLPKKSGYLFTPDSIYSSDGRCRPFDQKSEGTVFSDGAGAVLLKRKSEAIRDGDRIHAVIKGSFVNNDGSNKMNFFSPSASGQAEAVAQALAIADIEPETISYIEAHGTGTAIGDAIEIEALKEAFSIYTQRENFCGIGSLKSNVGHLNAAAGIAGLIKAIFVAKTNTIPATLHFEKLNSNLKLRGSPFFIYKDSNYQIPQSGYPTRVGVSSFGIGGTNAHLVLESYQSQFSKKNFDHLPAIIPLSAETKTSQVELRQNLLKFIQKYRPRLHDIAYTLQVGRKSMRFREVLVAQDIESLMKQLENEGQCDLLPNSCPDIKTLVQTWLKGEKNHLKIYQEEKPNKITLPFYSFDRKRFWVEKNCVTLRKSAPAPSRESELESILLIFWNKILGEEVVEHDPDFFQLGGDSLKAVELIELIKSVFAVNISLNEFFSASLLSKMGLLLEKKMEERNLNHQPSFT